MGHRDTQVTQLYVPSGSGSDDYQKSAKLYNHRSKVSLLAHSQSRMCESVWRRGLPKKQNKKCEHLPKLEHFCAFLTSPQKRLRLTRSPTSGTVHMWANAGAAPECANAAPHAQCAGSDRWQIWTEQVPAHMLLSVSTRRFQAQPTWHFQNVLNLKKMVPTIRQSRCWVESISTVSSEGWKLKHI